MPAAHELGSNALDVYRSTLLYSAVLSKRPLTRDSKHQKTPVYYNIITQTS